MLPRAFPLVKMALLLLNIEDLKSLSNVIPSKQLEISVQLESEINVGQSRRLLSLILSRAKALSSRNTETPWATQS